MRIVGWTADPCCITLEEMKFYCQLAQEEGVKLALVDDLDPEGPSDRALIFYRSDVPVDHSDLRKEFSLAFK